MSLCNAGKLCIPECVAWSQRKGETKVGLKEPDSGPIFRIAEFKLQGKVQNVATPAFVYNRGRTSSLVISRILEKPAHVKIGLFDLAYIWTTDSEFPIPQNFNLIKKFCTYKHSYCELNILPRWIYKVIAKMHGVRYASTCARWHKHMSL